MYIVEVHTFQFFGKRVLNNVSCYSRRPFHQFTNMQQFTGNQQPQLLMSAQAQQVFPAPAPQFMQGPAQQFMPAPQFQQFYYSQIQGQNQGAGPSGIPQQGYGRRIIDKSNTQCLKCEGWGHWHKDGLCIPEDVVRVNYKRATHQGAANALTYQGN